ncbi:MAG TPA: amidohydrolase family protein [Candidatus Atribacteria bacterium]|nr:amidohydrolase family protein [Candidatus Atribacteria bacterium]
MTKISQELFSLFLESPKIDTHEHLLPPERFIESPDILFSILERSYLSWILSGTTGKSFNLTREELLSRVKTIPASSFYRYLIKAFQFMYEFQDNSLSQENWEGLSRQIRENYENNDMVKKWLSGRLNIQKIILDRYWIVGDFQVDREIFSPVLRLDPFFFGYNREARDHDGQSPYFYANREGIKVETFDEYLNLIDHIFQQGIKEGISALKLAIAYDRGLSFNQVTREKAEVAFYREAGEETLEEIVNFQDFIFHYSFQKAEELGLPVQIHTGPGKAFQAAPSLLGPILETYRAVKISIFHGGFPWVGEPGAMALFYPNLYLDLVWLPLLSPTFSRLALSEWIETTGGARIMMGGDSWNVEGAVGSILFNLETMARVLGEMVDTGYLSVTDAQEIGKMVLWSNPEEFFAS